ncbi:MAG: hypothetical protein M3Y91_16915 [Actinomycetota bacterium]|nr:hypothetical protein [Actinomycetota bacterium]
MAWMMVATYVAISPLDQGTTLGGLNALLQAFETALPALAQPFESAVASGCGSCQEFLTGSPFSSTSTPTAARLCPGSPTPRS